MLGSHLQEKHRAAVCSLSCPTCIRDSGIPMSIPQLIQPVSPSSVLVQRQKQPGDKALVFLGLCTACGNWQAPTVCSCKEGSRVKCSLADC